VKNPQRQLLIATIVGFALSGSAFGQATTSPPPAGSPTKGAASTATDGTSKAMVKDADASHPLKAARLSELDGVDLFDASNKKIGEIEEIYVDAKSGKVHQVVLETGGVAGIGGKKHAVSLSDLKLFSKAADDNKPVKATAAKSVDGLPAAERPAKDSPYVAADKYLGTDIVDASGKKVGEVEDLVVDLSSGQTSYVLVEFDQSWSAKDKLFAFKPADLLPGKDKGAMQVNATRETLNQLPSLDKSRLDKSDLSNMPAVNR
jgi:sporulation protein YlmC with PRC-barrel domain